MIGGERLLYERGGICSTGTPFVIRIVRPRNEDRGQAAMFCREMCLDLETRHLRHVNVQDNTIGLIFLQPIKKSRTGTKGFGSEAKRTDQPLQCLGHGGMVFDYYY